MEYIPPPSAEDMLNSYSEAMDQLPVMSSYKIVSSTFPSKFLPSADVNMFQMDALVEGLGKLHEGGIFHRDLNTPNYIVYERGDEFHIIFLDFSFSQPVCSWGLYCDGESYVKCSESHGPLETD